MRLGLKKLHTIVRLIALKATLNQMGRIDRFWDTAVEVADISAALIKLRTDKNSDDAYSLGMLHDCGIPIMMKMFPEYKAFLLKLSPKAASEVHIQEQSQYGFDHYEVGAKVAEKWSMPSDVCSAVRAQSSIESCLQDQVPDYTESSQILLAHLLLAKDISRSYRSFWRASDSRETPSFLESALNYLGLSDLEYIELKDKMLDKMVELE